MCALFGIVGSYEQSVALNSVQTMQHRGPDSCEVITQTNLFFAHSALHIQEKNPKKRQPRRSSDIIISFNGEIYNFQTLKETHNLSHNSDELDVILELYKRYKETFVSYLDGMFSIAIFDQNRLYLFRDRFGKKPLYYLQTEHTFIFASEIKALKPHLKSLSLNNDALLSYLNFLTPTTPHTFYEGIQKLDSGTMLMYKDGKSKIKPYYNLLETPLKEHSRTSSSKEIQGLLEHSVEQRIQADVPIAALLSGGIDSALINAIAKNQGHALPTYTLGYKEYQKYDERAQASSTADFLGLQNTQVEISQEDFFSALPQVLNTLDEPLNDPAAVPLYILMQKIKEDGYKVVLSGEGSDEIFLGYRQYFEFLDIENIKKLRHKNWMKNYLKENFSHKREWVWYKRVFEGSTLFRGSSELFNDEQLNKLLRQNIPDNNSLSFFSEQEKTFKNSRFEEESFWYTYRDLKHHQGEYFLNKLDKISMAHSLEARTPFLDHHLVESVFSLDPKIRIKENRTKHLLKEIAANYLSPEIIARKKKGFSNPYMEYLNNSSALDIITQVNSKTRLFKDESLKFYLEGSKKGRFKHHVWGLFVLSHWLRENLL